MLTQITLYCSMIKLLTKHAALSRTKEAFLHRQFSIVLRLNLGWWEEFSVNLGAHEESSSRSASNQKDPDRTPAECFLERSNSEETNGSSDGTASVNKTSDSTKGLVVSLDRGMGSKIRRDSRGDNVIGPN